MPANLENSAVATGLEKFSAQSQKKTMPKNLLLDDVQFTLFHGPKIPGSYAILFLQQCTLLLPDTCKMSTISALAQPLLSGAISNPKR